MKIVCIGSSSVEGIGDKRGIGWVGRLNEYLQRKSENINEFRVFNLGLKGDTLAGTMYRYQNEALKRNPHLVIIFTGTNDCMRQAKNGELIAGPKPEDYIKKWNMFLDVLNKAGHRTIILGPTMVDESAGSLNFKDTQISFKNSDLAEYNRNLKFLSQQRDKVEYIELLNLFSVDTEQYSFDFVHPNEKGYGVICNYLIEKMKDLKYVK